MSIVLHIDMWKKTKNIDKHIYTYMCMYVPINHERQKLTTSQLE